MIEFVRGKLVSRTDDSLVVDLGGFGMRIFVSKFSLTHFSAVVPGQEIMVFCQLRLREDGADLYGFYNQDELRIFRLLNTISGVGPKSAISILNIASLEELVSAISEKRADLLTSASGVGRKTAERIILELSGRVVAPRADEVVKKMEIDQDIVETLVGLGYRKDEAQRVISKIDASVQDINSRLKLALKILAKR
ncbi:MAG: holliday junction DNA helicase RuvA [Parcubacteria group bacterium Gr01-1014_20]|nr:MAG: holliday junction DNA helicase RuvA [Parcubacteria group bacterium Gr01-1014_20]